MLITIMERPPAPQARPDIRRSSSERRTNSRLQRYATRAAIGLGALALLIPGAQLFLRSIDNAVTNDMTVSGNTFLAAERAHTRCLDPEQKMTQVRKIIATDETIENGGANARRRPTVDAQLHDRFPRLPIGSTLVTAPADYEYSPDFQGICAIYGPDGTPVMVEPASPNEMAFIAGRTTEVIQASIGR